MAHRESYLLGKKLTNIKQRYKIDKDFVFTLLLRQKRTCAICSTPFVGKNFTVDHCHKTGAVRGLLCLGCNSGIGQLKDDPERIARALKYLESHGTHSNTFTA